MTGTTYPGNNTLTQVQNSNASSHIWKNYVDLYEDVLPWLQIPTTGTAAASASDLQKLQLLTDMTCQWAQRKLSNPIAPHGFYRRFNGWSGWNGAYVELPYYPVLQVVSVVEWWGLGGPHQLSEQTPQHDIDGFQLDALRGKVIRVFPGLVQRPWFPGSRSIEIQWVAGYNPVPADWKVATLEMIGHWWHYSQQTQRVSIRAGSDGAEQVAAGLWSGVPLRISELLDSGVQIGIG
jgi:hypothetical protein